MVGSVWIGFLLSLCIFCLNACNGANFNGGGQDGGNGPKSPPPVDPPVPPEKTSPPTTTICTPGQQAIGGNVVFLIDNSASNLETDCPAATSAGTQDDQCGAPTNREKAVLSAFDMLADVSTKDTGDDAVSQIAVVEFPTGSFSSPGSAVATQGFVPTRPLPESRQTLEKALLFTRQPSGGTPYGVAVDAAARIFSTVPQDQHARVAILVTDGEPTDRDPFSVAEQAAELRTSGVEIITIFVTANSVRTQRQMEHEKFLREVDREYPFGHYYNTQHYATIDDYINDILGLNGRLSLAQNITSQTSATCVDKPGQPCQRYIVEVNDSTGLTDAVQQIVRQRTVQCR